MINLAIIGFGHWGKNFYKTFQQIPGVHVQCICDSSPPSDISKTLKYPETSFVYDYNMLLDDPVIQAIVISTPANTHHEIAKKCLLAGKHVLVEKPMALNTKDCQELIDIAEHNKLILMVGHTFLYNDSIKQIAHNLPQEVGQIYTIKFYRNHLGLIRDDVSVLWDLLPHDISICNYLLERLPKYVHAHGSCITKEDREDIVNCVLYYQGDSLLGECNVMVNMEATWLDTNKKRQIEIIGSKGKIGFDDLDSLESVRIFNKGLAVNVKGNYVLRDGDIISPNIKRTEPLLNECRDFIAAVENGNPFNALPDGQNGLEVVQVLSALQESLDNDGIRINL